MKEKVNLYSNIIDDEKTEYMINYTLETLANSLSKSVGPYGCNTILQDMTGNHSITKDGYTIFKELKLDNDISRTILDIIRNISLKLVNEVGDASTSSILIAYSLYNTLKQYKPINWNVQSKGKPLSPKLIKDILKYLEDELISLIKDVAIPINNDNFDVVTKIASISNNNDYILGNLIKEIYSKIGKDSFITIERSVTSEDYYEISNGYEINDGYLDTRFINNTKEMLYEGESPIIFISNSLLDEDDLEPLLQPLCGFALSKMKDLVIIAKGYTEEVYNFLAINKQRNKDLSVCPISTVLGTENREELLKDLSIYVGNEMIYDKNYFTPQKYKDEFFGFDEMCLLGTCKKVISDKKQTKFILGEYNNGDYLDRIAELETTIKHCKEKAKREENDMELFELEKRLNKLKGNIATIYVGGNTEIEKKNRRYLIDDSIHAVRSALNNGYVIGGNLLIPYIIEYQTEELSKTIKDKIKKDLNIDISLSLLESFIESVGESFEFSYKCVLRNTYMNNSKSNDIITNCFYNEKNTLLIYNVLTNEYEDITETSVINSADTDIQIMHSVFSIIGLLITSNQFISLTCYSDKAFEEFILE